MVHKRSDTYLNVTHNKNQVCSTPLKIAIKMVLTLLNATLLPVFPNFDSLAQKAVSHTYLVDTCQKCLAFCCAATLRSAAITWGLRREERVKRKKKEGRKAGLGGEASFNLLDK